MRLQRVSERKDPNPAQLYEDAVWEAGPDELTSAEAMMALCYANHAHTAPHDRAWVVDRRIMRYCKIRSAGTVGRVRDSLVAKGWLVPLHPDTGAPLAFADAKDLQRRRVTLTYRLARPAAPTVGAEADRETAPMSGVVAPTIEVATAPMVVGPAPTIDTNCSDGRSRPSKDPLRDPLSPPDPVVDLVCASGAVRPDEDEREFIAWMKEKHRDKGMGWWRHIVGNGDVHTHADTWRAGRTAAQAEPAPRPCVA